MKILAAILLMVSTLQDKPVQPTPAPEQPKPVVLPESKPVELKITNGSAPAVDATRPSEAQTIANSENTIRVRITAEQIEQLMAEKNSQASSDKPSIVFETGAVYIKTGSFTVPLSGGGASGCFGAASHGKITFHDPAIQRMIGAEKPPASEKK